MATREYTLLKKEETHISEYSIEEGWLLNNRISTFIKGVYLIARQKIYIHVALIQGIGSDVIKHDPPTVYRTPEFLLGLQDSSFFPHPPFLCFLTIQRL